MRTVVSATGYINVITVVNMKRFIVGEASERKQFEALRGTSEFADVIRRDWAETISTNKIFHISDIARQDYNSSDQMTTEYVGFSTGVFRSLILEKESFPTYAVNKQEKFFENHFQYLESNYQFSTLFLDIWNNWDIYIRPVYTGLFVLRLLRKYQKPTTLLTIAKDVNRLQESFDIPSAFDWWQKVHNDPKLDNDEKQKKEHSIQEFLKWLGKDEDTEKISYIPVQPRLAMEVASLFVEEIAKMIPVAGKANIRLARPAPRKSTPLHDSYVIYHIDELYVNRSSKPKHRDVDSMDDVPAVDTMEQISIEDVKETFSVQQQLCNLIEGAVLKPFSSNFRSSTSGSAVKERFPALRSDTVQEIMNNNLSSWEDELCFILGRSAIFIPSRRYRNHQLVVSTMSRSTSYIKYIRYWGAIERMAELILSVRVLTQLLEKLSYSLLEKTISEMYKIRSELLQGDIKMDTRELSRLISEAANLQRLASLCQGLSNPHVWSRAEYGIVKAKRLIDQLGIFLSLEHIQRNIDAINQFGDHIDELYLGDLAERNNTLSFWSSVGLAGVSFILTMLILPSFWADIKSVEPSAVGIQSFVSGWLPSMELIGSILAGSLVVFALGMVLWAITNLYHTKQIGKYIRRKIGILLGK